MKPWQQKILFPIFSVGFFLQSSGQTYIHDQIKNDTVWTESGNPYLLLDDVIVNENAKLILEPGVIVKPVNSTAGLHIFGTLVIDGSPEKPVVFTSFADDIHGGDSNGDGDNSTPEPGDWNSIHFYYPGKNNRITNAWFGYGGSNSSVGTIYNKSLSLEIDSCTFYASQKNVVYSLRSVSIENCRFTENQKTCIYLELQNASAEINITENIFSGNLEQPATICMNGTNVLLNSKGNHSSGSGMNGITTANQNLGNLTFSGDSLLPLILDVGEVPVSTRFSLNGGSWVKFIGKNSRLTIGGTINAKGTKTNPVVFTSIYDNPSVSAETDTLLRPAPGDWDRVIINKSETGNVLQNVEFRYGGSGGAMVILYNSASEIDSCIFSNSLKTGLFVQYTSQVIFYANQMKSSNIIPFSGQYGLGLIISNCIFSGNKTNGILLKGDRFSEKTELINNQFLNNHFAVQSNISQINSDIILENNVAGGNFRNGFSIGGTISGNITLQTDVNFPFIINNLTVDSSATLKLLPGSVVKMEEMATGLNVYGNIIWQGTETEPIIFTSVKDDSVAGDTNGDSESIPGGSDWENIWFFRSSHSLLIENCWFRYGSRIVIENDNVEIRNCTFSNFGQDAVYVNNSSPLIHHNRITGSKKSGVHFHNSNSSGLSGNYFDNNYLPVLLEYDTISTNISFVNNDNQISGAGIRAVGLKAGISGEVILTQNDNFPFVLCGIKVYPSSKLILPAGGIFKIAENGINIQGMLDVLGTKEEPVIITSVKDDARGGDTNGDGSATKPTRGDWGSITFNSNFNSHISYLWLGYGGISQNSAILIFTNSGRKNFGSSIIVENSVITQSSSSGILLHSYSEPEIRNCKISNNQENGILVDQSKPILYHNDISGNGFYGVKNMTQQQSFNVDARYNYWGDSSGPFHYLKNPVGKGDYVSDFVWFDPFLTEPVMDWVVQHTRQNLLFNETEVFPVPASHEVNMVISLTSSSHLRINLLDNQGRFIDTILDEFQAGGKMKVCYTVENLRNGIYYTEILAGSTRQVKKVVVSHLPR